MRALIIGMAAAASGLLSLACQQSAEAPPGSQDAQEIQGIQIATDAYVAYQHSDCETVYRLTQPGVVDALQATELRHSLRLVRGFCQEIDGDPSAARQTYRRLIDEAPSSFAAQDARERLRLLDRELDDPSYARRSEDAARRVLRPSEPREPSARSAALYPPLARASAVEGFAVVEFGIARNGKTVDPIVVASDPPFLFDGAALRAVREWLYKSKRDADPEARHAIRIVFRPTAPPTLSDEAAAPASAPIRAVESISSGNLQGTP
ncbi:MAG: energy transducer TonB [Myxococcota bacterium]